MLIVVAVLTPLTILIAVIFQFNYYFYLKKKKQQIKYRLKYTINILLYYH